MGIEVNYPESLARKYLKITVVVVAYWFISISMVFINKYILSGKSVGLEAPLFVTFFQCTCSALICGFMDFMARFKLINENSFPRLHLRLDVMKRVLPLSTVFVAMITFNNLCLKYVGVPFYFVGRSLTTVFNVVLTFYILGTRTSVPALSCCGVIILGFFLGVDQESITGSISYLGVIFGVLASLFVSLNSIYTKSILPIVDNSIWLLTFYNSINAIILFIPLMLITGEVSIVMSYNRLDDPAFWNIMFLSGLFGFAIGYVSGLQIKFTSPLTHNISGTAKACFQTVIAVVWFEDSKSFLWWFSNLLVIFASAAYARIKQIEMRIVHFEEDGQNILNKSRP